MSSMTRRDLLKALPVAAIATACRTKPYDDRDFVVAARSAVGLFSAPTYETDFADVIGRGFRELGIDLRGKHVLLKPNLVEYAPGAAINTHPMVVAGAAVAALRAGAADVVVGEGPGHRRDIEYLLQATGFTDALNAARVRFVDLNHDDVRTVRLASRFTTMTELMFSVELLRSDFIISMPKMKTHHWAGVTLSMKNLFGTVPGQVVGWPKNLLHWIGIGNSIVDLWSAVMPGLAIIDGIVGMEGDGPIMGTAVDHGVLLVSDNCPAADAEAVRLMGMDPWKFDYYRIAATMGGTISPLKTEIVGDAIERREYAVLDKFTWLRG